MHPTLQQFVDADVSMELNPPASLKAIKKFEKKHGIRFPDYYKEFLLFANGGMLIHDSFFGLDPENGFSLEKENRAGENSARGAYKIPDSLYIVGSDSCGDPVCIDQKTQEIVLWDHETSEEFLRYASFYDYIFNAFEVFDSVMEEYEDHPVPAPPAGRITDMFCNLDVLYMTMAGGKYDGQTIAAYSQQLDENRFKIHFILAKQISPVTREEANSTYTELKAIREFSLARYEGYDLKALIEEYCAANPNGIEIVL